MPESAWNIDSLHEHLVSLLNAGDKRYEQRFLAQETAVQNAMIAQEKAVNAALMAQDKAVTKAETAAEKRMDSVNEFRGQLRDQAGTFIPRIEVDAKFTGFDKEMRDLKSRLDTAEGKLLGAGALWGYIIGALGAIVGSGGIAAFLVAHYK